MIASEDGSFVDHDGVDWEALEKAWEQNAQAEQRADKAASRRQPARRRAASAAKPPKIVGGSTITQQLAKNLLLSGERTLLRKGQELVLTLLLEALLSKQRILEIYLNSVEWGEGVFGAEAAAQHYFRKPAARLSAYEAARLAVMLPRPKYFENPPRLGLPGRRAPSTIVGAHGRASGAFAMNIAHACQAMSLFLLGLIRVLTGAQARWHGCPPKAEQRIYFANHQSHADLVLIWAALPQELRSITRPIAAKDYWTKTPFKQWITTAVFNAIYVDRDARPATRTRWSR